MPATEKSYSEHQIIDNILGGSQDEFRILVNRHSPMVFHIIREFEKDENEVEELAQQVFLDAYKRLHVFNRDLKFSSWLHAITVSHCRDYIKKIRKSNIRLFLLKYRDELSNETISGLLGGAEGKGAGKKRAEDHYG
ncbi:MAG: sigma-70 family RNA polymerase sigma factor [Balneolales bacterium]